MNHVIAIIAIVFSLLLAPSLLQASHDSHKACDVSFSNGAHVEVISSGRDHDVLDLYTKVLTEFYEPGGLADRLNIAKPDHQAIFTPSAQLAMLASIGRHPVPHWLDGASLLEAFRAAGVMEFVTPGCPTCRSFYSDTTSAIHQISIIYHVFGHNNFSANSYLSRIRNVDPIAESVYLADLMSQLYQQENPDEVAQWYQYLSTLETMQDMTRGSFDAPETFNPQAAYNKDGKRLPFPRSPTPSVIQAIVANLPLTTPKWKIEMAQIYERMMRVRGFVPPTKIMNEGFATIMQEIIAAHSKYNTSEHVIEFAHLFAGVVGRGSNPTNPYWTGREAWRALRRRFNVRPEIAGLSAIEQDSAFIKYANSLIETMTDFDFLRMAFDERFVREQKLFVFKEVPWNKLDRSLPRTDPKHNAQFEVTSRDARTIIDELVGRIADLRVHLPTVQLSSFEAEGNSAVEFTYVPFNKYPLHGPSAAQTLLVKARILEKTTILKTLLVTKTAPPPMHDTPNNGAYIWYPPARARAGDLEKVVEAKIIVTPSGKVDVFTKDDGSEGAYEKNEALTTKYQASVDSYLDSGSGFDGVDLNESDRRRFQPLAVQVIDTAMNPVMASLSHAPTAARALHEYAKIAKNRMAKALALLKQGKLKFRSTKGGIAIKLFPDIPSYQYDRRAIKRLSAQNNVSVGPLDAANFLKTDAAFSSSMVDIGQGDKGVGDKYWGTKPDEGEGEAEDGEEGDVEEEGEVPGKGKGGKGATPQEVEISFDVLNEILDLELPNRKARSTGSIDILDRERDGGAQRSDDNLLWGRMMPGILAKGRAMLINRWKKQHPNEAVPWFSPVVVMKEGLKYLDPQQHIVTDHAVVKEPESKGLLIRIMDQSGSMHGKPQEIIKQFYHHMIMMLQNKYKSLEVINIGFNESKAIVMTDEQFFGEFLSGGDSYILGWAKANEVLKDPKYADYDKYGLMAGDFQSAGGEDVEAEMKKLLAQLNWGAAIQTVVDGDVGFEPLIAPIKALAETDPWFDYGTLTSGMKSRIELLLKFFGKDRPKKP